MIFVLTMLFTFVYDRKNENHWSLLVTHDLLLINHYSLITHYYSTLQRVQVSQQSAMQKSLDFC